MVVAKNTMITSFRNKWKKLVSDQKLKIYSEIFLQNQESIYKGTGNIYLMVTADGKCQAHVEAAVNKSSAEEDQNFLI